MTEAAWDVLKETYEVDTVYTPADGSPAENISGILTYEFTPMPFDGADFSSRTALLYVKLSDLLTPPEKGAQLSPLNGDSWKVTDLQPDGVGGTALVVEKL
jgi:hypothetical protein